MALRNSYCERTSRETSCTSRASLRAESEIRSTSAGPPLYRRLGLGNRVTDLYTVRSRDA